MRWPAVLFVLNVLNTDNDIIKPLRWSQAVRRVRWGSGDPELLRGSRFVSAYPDSSPNWEELIATNGIKFTARNAHASCVFKKKIWITGGRTALYTMYNLLDSYKEADVWKSANGAIWEQEELLRGDFFAQNTDVTQPGPIAPWYHRYGHSLDAVDTNGDGEDDLMVMAGGYASQPSNDVWVSDDGNSWVYTGFAPWSPRAWHSTTIFQGKLWLMGGTPLNNEVWFLQNITRVENRTEPLTRSLFTKHTYNLTWVRAPDAPWSPRVGAGLVSQWYFNTSRGETLQDSRERLVLVGGYGGFVKPHPAYDGYYSRADSWQTFNGLNWTLLNSSNAIEGRAWMGVVVRHDANPRIDMLIPGQEPPRIFLFGGGYIGFTTYDKRRVSAMQGKADAWWSIDGAIWKKISYEEGGGSSTVPYYSSQEWARTIVDTRTNYLGLWGLSVHSFNASTGQQYPGDLILIAGDYTSEGDYSSGTYRSLPGMFCDADGVICNGRGSCSDAGCSCDDGFGGVTCENVLRDVVAGASRNGFFVVRNLISGTWHRVSGAAGERETTTVDWQVEGIQLALFVVLSLGASISVLRT